MPNFNMNLFTKVEALVAKNVWIQKMLALCSVPWKNWCFFLGTECTTTAIYIQCEKKIHLGTIVLVIQFMNVIATCYFITLQNYMERYIIFHCWSTESPLYDYFYCYRKAKTLIPAIWDWMACGFFWWLQFFRLTIQDGRYYPKIAW